MGTGPKFRNKTPKWFFEKSDEQSQDFPSSKAVSSFTFTIVFVEWMKKCFRTKFDEIIVQLFSLSNKEDKMVGPF